MGISKRIDFLFIFSNISLDYSTCFLRDVLLFFMKPVAHVLVSSVALIEN